MEGKIDFPEYDGFAIRPLRCLRKLTPATQKKRNFLLCFGHKSKLWGSVMLSITFFTVPALKF